jgi:hypothetical protein
VFHVRHRGAQGVRLPDQGWRWPRLGSTGGRWRRGSWAPPALYATVLPYRARAATDDDGGGGDDRANTIGLSNGTAGIGPPGPNTSGPSTRSGVGLGGCEGRPRHGGHLGGAPTAARPHGYPATVLDAPGRAAGPGAGRVQVGAGRVGCRRRFWHPVPGGRDTAVRVPRQTAQPPAPPATTDRGRLCSPPHSFPTTTPTRATGTTGPDAVK